MPVHALKTAEEFGRYADFAHQVYRDLPDWVPEDKHRLIGLLSGAAPNSAHARSQAFWVTEGEQILATVTAVVDETFNRHWDERLGHLVLFEALPGHDEQVRALIQRACEWLRAEGSRAARMAFLFGWQNALTMDAYDVVPSFFHTYNPGYYHRLIKNAGFATEHGMVEYQVEFTPELAGRYRQMVERVMQAGVKLRAWDFARLEEEAAQFTDLYNETFAKHWGAPQFTLPEIHEITVGLKDFLVPKFTAFAEADGQTVGMVYALPDLNRAFHPLRGKNLEEHFGEFQERLRGIDHGLLVVIGVKEGYRGRGINLGLAARSYLAMIERGYRSASYTVVLDDNWPSRRTAEKLGCRVVRNFICYRRELA